MAGVIEGFEPRPGKAEAGQTPCNSVVFANSGFHVEDLTVRSSGELISGLLALRLVLDNVE